MSLRISVDPDLAQRGIKVAAATISIPKAGKHRGSALSAYVKDSLTRLHLETALASPVLEAYQEFYPAAGVLDARPPARRLLEIIARTGRLPNINRIVDCYNISSVETLLSLGAHDLSDLQDDLGFTWVKKSLPWWPLGDPSPTVLTAGEYAFVDREKVLCRMDIRQCQETRLKETTRQFLLYVQGNRLTSQEDVDNALEHTCRLLRDFCEGTIQRVTPRLRPFGLDE